MSRSSGLVYCAAILLKRLEVQHGKGTWLWATQVVAGLRQGRAGWLGWGRAGQDRVPMYLCLCLCLCSLALCLTACVLQEAAEGMRVDPQGPSSNRRS